MRTRTMPRDGSNMDGVTMRDDDHRAERIAPRTYIGRTPMPVSLKEILGAFEFVSAGGMGEHQAFLCKQSGKIYWHSELSDDLNELPTIQPDEQSTIDPTQMRPAWRAPLKEVVDGCLPCFWSWPSRRRRETWPSYTQGGGVLRYRSDLHDAADYGAST
jgi:hypothetical protein